jgi:hypothetical protein
MKNYEQKIPGTRYRGRAESRSAAGCAAISAAGVEISGKRNVDACVILGKMAASAYNCSLNSGSVYAYNSSQSPAVSLQLCRQLLNAKCLTMDLDPTYCSDSNSPATAAIVKSRLASDFCQAYWNEDDALAACIIGFPLVAAFLINAAFLFFRARRPTLAPKNDEFTMSMVSPLDQDTAFVLPEKEAAKRALQSDSLGSFGRLLPLFGLTWLRAPNSSRARQALRLAFVLWNILIPIHAVMRLVRSYFGRTDTLNFLATYNKCSSLCGAAGGGSCPEEIPILFVCSKISSDLNLLDYLECRASGRVEPLAQAGFVVQLMLLILPLHSLLVCVFHWPRLDNPVLLALYNMKQFSPIIHRQCCDAVTKFISALMLTLLLLSIFVRLPLIISQQDCQNPMYQSCKTVATGNVYLELFFIVAFCLFQSLAPIGMVILYASSAFIVRVRMRAVVTIFRFVSTFSSNIPPNASDSMPSGQDVLIALHLCRCPHTLILKIRPLLMNTEQDGQKAAAAAMRPRLQMLWMMQLREMQLLTNFGQKWLLIQALVVAILLIPLALFCFIAALYPILV